MSALDVPMPRKSGLPSIVAANVGDPIAVHWFAEGRPATRDEVLASIDSGLPILREMAESEGDEAVTALGQMHSRALEVVPA